MKRLRIEASHEPTHLATPSEVEQLLGVWRTAYAGQTAPGLEARIVARLQTESPEISTSGDRRTLSLTAFQVGRARSWAPVAMAASLLGVFAGGLLMTQEAFSIAGLHHLRGQEGTTQALRIGTGQAPMPGLSQPANSSSNATLMPIQLATAGARRKPVVLVPAGHRRGRATTDPGLPLK